MPSEPRMWHTGEIQIDLLTRKAFYHNSEIKLSDLSFDTMMVLVEVFPETLSSEQIMDLVWQKSAVSPETVTQRIALIRKALNEAGLDAKQYLAATRQVGYRWLKPVKAADQLVKKYPKAPLLAAMFLILLVAFFMFYRNQSNQTIKEANTTATITAHDITKQAWQYLDKHNPQSNQVAIGMFRQALDDEPSDVDALIGLSVALSHEVTKFNQSNHLLKEARAVALKATQLKPANDKAWTALAFVDDASGDIDVAIQGYEKAMELNPENASAVSSLAYLYGLKGRLVEAIQLNLSASGSKQHYLDLQIAQTLALLGFDVVAEQWYYKVDVLSPDNVFATSARAEFYLSRNQVNKAVEIIEAAQNRGVERPELPVLLGLIAWKKGDQVAAKDYFQAASLIDENDMQSALIKYSLPLNLQQSTVINHAGLLTSQSWPSQAVYQAHYQASLGQAEAVFESLQHAFELGYRNHAWLSWLPAFDAYKQDQRWIDLIMLMQDDVGQQRQQLLNVSWLPPSFLNPTN